MRNMSCYEDHVFSTHFSRKMEGLVYGGTAEWFVLQVLIPKVTQDGGSRIKGRLSECMFDKSGAAV